ncbi:MAG: M56 family metallopeptidase, partial [Candidatus Hydrogenedentales bacterium]
MEVHIASANDLASQWLGSLWPAVWQSALLAFAVLILARLLKNAPASLRFWLWMLVPLRLLVMPFVCITVPVLPAPSVHEAAAIAESSSSSTLSDEIVSPWNSDRQQVYVAATHDSPLLASSETAVRTSIKWPLVALTVWGIGVLVLSLRMARGWFWMRRLVADSTRVIEGPLVDAANKAAALLGLKYVPRLVVTDAEVSPFTCGVRQPLVVLPKTFVQKANRHSLLAVLAHEFAHVRRRDSLLGFVLCICDALYFFHPVVHLVRRRILFEREKACDALVLAASNARPSAYASAICDAAQLSMSTRPLTSPPLLVAESFGDLKGRLTALASEAAPKARLSLASVFVLLLLGILCVPGIILTTSEPVESAVLAPAAEPPSQLNPHGAQPSPVRLTAADSVAAAPQQQPTATRVIRFPRDRAIGMLYTRTTPTVLRHRLSPNYSAVDSWDVLAAAQGNVAVPVDAKVKLIISGQAIQGDLSALARLKPDDLYALEISCHEDIRPYSDNTIMPHLSELTGLKELTVRLPDLTDQGMRHLKALTGLEFLSV